MTKPPPSTHIESDEPPPTVPSRARAATTDQTPKVATPIPPPPLPAPPTSSLPGSIGAVIALITAVGGLVTSYQQNAASLDTQRSTYAALKQADDEKSRQLAELAHADLLLRSWIAELSAELDRRTSNTDKTLRKVSKTKPPAAPSPPPPTPTVTPSTPLPSFETLRQTTK